MLDTNKNPALPAFLVQESADAALLRELGANVSLIEDGIGGAAGGDNVVLIARGNGRELLQGMNLASTGRFINLESGASLAEFLCSREHDPLGCLDELARDVFWA